MPSQATLETLRDLFWPLYVLAIVCGATAALRQRNICIGRVTFALMAASLAQTLWEGPLVLTWWQHFVIDLCIFPLIVLPPRNKWSAIVGGFVFAQLFLHCIWAAVPDWGRQHWFYSIIIGYAKCSVLILWSGGARVENTIARLAIRANDLVLLAPRRKLAP